MDAQSLNNDQSVLNYIKERLNDNSFKLKIQKLMEGFDSNEDWWNTISDGEKKAIEEGLNDVKSGNVSSHNEVMGRMKQKYSQYF